MEEDMILRLLKEFPGAKRASNGVLFESEFGTFYMYGIDKKIEGISGEEQLANPFCSRNEMLRLREIKTAHDYLLRMRSEAIASSARLGRAFEARKQRFVKSGRSWSLSDYYATLNSPLKTYLNRLPKRHAAALRGVPAGFCPLLEANAICFASILGNIVVVSELLELFFYFMMISINGGTIGIDLSSRVTAAIIAARIMNGAESQDFDIDPRGFLSGKQEAWIQSHVKLMLEFTFGHEFAHLTLGHLSSTSEITLPAGPKLIREYSHSLEFAADLHAINSIPHQKRDLARTLSTLHTM